MRANFFLAIFCFFLFPNYALAQDSAIAPPNGTLAAYITIPERQRKAVLTGFMLGADQACIGAMSIASESHLVAAEDTYKVYVECATNYAFSGLQPENIEAAINRLAQEDFADKVTLKDALLFLGLSRSGDSQKLINYDFAKEKLTAHVRQGNGEQK